MSIERPKPELSAGQTGIKIGAATIGGIAGAVLAGPLGAAAGSVTGAAIAPLLEHLGLQFSGVLGGRERARLEGVFEAAQEQIRRNLAARKVLRADGFLSTGASDHSDAEEIFEAVIRKTQTEHENRKVKYLGILLGNLPFDSRLDRSQANLLVRIAFELSYRQYCLLALFNRPADFHVSFKYETEVPSTPILSFGTIADLSPDEFTAYQAHQEASAQASKLRDTERREANVNLTPTHMAIRQECYDLYSRGLIRLRMLESDGKLSTISALVYEEIIPLATGKLLFEHLGLKSIRGSELEYLASFMRTDPCY